MKDYQIPVLDIIVLETNDIICSSDDEPWTGGIDPIDPYDGGDEEPTP